MPVPTYEDSRRVISPQREQLLAWAVQAAWTDWQDCPSRGRYSRWPRTRANMLFERLADRLVEAFRGDDGVRFVFADETIKVILDELVVLRMKKGNGEGLGDNITTQAVLAFVEAQQEIPGLNGLWKLEGVYILNRLQTGIADVILQARDGQMKLFSYSILGNAQGQTVIVFPPPPPPTHPATTYNADDIVLPRGADKKDRKSEPRQE